MFEIASIDERVREFLEERTASCPFSTAPPTLLVHQEASRPDPDTDKILGYIAQDQVLVTDVLKVANSAQRKALRRSAGPRTRL